MRETARVSRQDLSAMTAEGVIDADQAERIWARLKGREASGARPRFDLVHLLWYAGALIVIAAMGLFSVEAWERHGGFTLAAITTAYAVAFTAVGAYLWHARGLRTAGGLLITVAVVMVPTTVGALQDALGWWDGVGSYPRPLPWAKGNWFFVQLSAMAASLLALRFFRFPLITVPLVAALWLLLIDLAPWLFGSSWTTSDKQNLLSVGIGVAVIAVAWLVDIRGHSDFAFWLHFAGLLAAWGGLSAMESGLQLGKILYCLANVLLLLLSIFLMRRAYAVFGAIGITIYLGDLASRVFKDSLLFPLALSAVGIAVIGLGLLYFRSREAIVAWFARSLPRGLQALRPAHARDG